MPYQLDDGSYEKSNVIGAHDILVDDAVKSAIKRWSCSKVTAITPSLALQQDSHTITAPTAGKALRFVYVVDGSSLILDTDDFEYKDHLRQYRAAFISTLILRLDLDYTIKVATEARKEMAQNGGVSRYNALLPLRHIWRQGLEGKGPFETLRLEVFESISRSPEIMETYKWLVYRKWHGNNLTYVEFKCPLCRAKGKTVIFAYDQDSSNCSNCKRKVFVTDRVIGFRKTVGKQSSIDLIPSTYMSIMEHLMLFNEIRLMWENDKGKDLLSESLFMMDGALGCSDDDLKKEILNFISFARNSEHNINIVSQEKSGRFKEHLRLIEPHIPNNIAITLRDDYIHTKVQGSEITDRQRRYGYYYNWGAKVLVKFADGQALVLNIPTKEPKKDPSYDDLIGADDIIHTIQKRLLNMDHINAIEMANDLVSIAKSEEDRLRYFTEDHFLK
jgi:hypothetical protein